MATLTVPGAVSGGTLGISDKKTLDGTILAMVAWQIPPRVGTITVQTVTAGAVYRVEVTANPIEDVSADSASWFDLYGADQSANQQRAIFASVSAVRVSRISGTGNVIACIRGQ